MKKFFTATRDTSSIDAKTGEFQTILPGSHIRIDHISDSTLRRWRNMEFIDQYNRLPQKGYRLA